MAKGGFGLTDNVGSNSQGYGVSDESFRTAPKKGVVKAEYVKELYDARDAAEKEIAKLKEKLEVSVQDHLLKIRKENELALYKRKLEYVELEAQLRADFQKKEFKDDKEKREKINKLLDKQEKADKLKDLADIHKKRLELYKSEREALKDYVEATLADPTAQLGEKISAFAKGTALALKEGAEQAVSTLGNGLLNIGKTLESDMNTIMTKYAQYSVDINTRLQGRSGNNTFKSLESYYKSTVGVTPYIKTETLMDNLSTLVQTGIAFNVEQRAFLQTVSEEVAQTFNVANSALLRIVKLQQQDSSASRLGMEAYLTSFLNTYFENTEYLSGAFDGVTESLVEAIATMGTTQGVEFEYIVQKWLGSLSSLGMSDSSISSIASAIGAVGSGNISELSGGMQNLVVMGANKAGLSYADLLTGGLTADSTNALLGGIVSYLQEIVNISSDNNVVASQLSETFGVSISDLTAIANLTAEDISNISKSTMTYSDTINELNYQLNQAGNRLTTEGLLSNLYDNSIFQAGINIASSPALYSMWKVTSMIEDLTGGIALPTVSVLGSYVDLNTSLTNLMRTGIVGAGSLGMIGDIIGGLGNVIGSVGGYGGNFGSTLEKLGIKSSSLVTSTRGSGLGRTTSGLSTSLSSYVGNSNSGEIYENALAGAKAEQEAQLADVAETELNVQNYLTDLFDPKMDAVVTMLSHISGLKVTQQQKAIGNTVSVSVPDNTTTEASKLDTISSNVASINNLLQSGLLTVKISGNPLGL